MKIAAVSTLVLALFLAPATPLAAQQSIKPHVGILVPVNSTGTASFDAGAKAAGDTVNLILEQTGLYEVTRSDLPSPAAPDPVSLGSLAEANSWDFVVFSSLQAVGSENPPQAIYRLAVYNRSQGRVSITKDSDPSELLDLFDAADSTVASVLGTMTGVHIGFGKIVLKPSGEAGTYQVSLDGRAVTEGALTKVLNGDHEVLIQAKRMLGTETYTRNRVQVEEGKTVEVPFSIPYLTPAESAEIDASGNAVTQLWQDPSKIDQVDKTLEAYQSLFGDVSYSPRLAALRQKVLDLKQAWPEQKAKLLEEASAQQVSEEEKRQEKAYRDEKIQDFENQKAALGPQYKERQYWDTWGWSSLAVGLGSLAVSIYPLVQVYSNYNALASATDSNTYNSEVKAVEQYRPLANVTLALAATGLILAPVFFSTGPKKATLDDELQLLDNEIAGLQQQE